MKRIVNGLAYDTDKSTVIAKAEYDWDPDNGVTATEGTLYRTAGGAFFEVIEIKTEDENGVTNYKSQLGPLSEVAAYKWLEIGQVELIDDSFAEVAEATEENVETTATIYVRTTPTLKRQVEFCSKNAGLSVNAYVIRCLAAGVAPDDKARAALVDEMR